MINTTSESMKERKIFTVQHFSFYEHINFMLRLNEHEKKGFIISGRGYEIWYLSYMLEGKAHTSLCKSADSQEPSLFAMSLKAQTKNKTCSLTR